MQRSPLDPDDYILGTNADEDGTTVRTGLEAHGISVHEIPFGNHTVDGGSIRCSTHPLRGGWVRDADDLRRPRR